LQLTKKNGETLRDEYPAKIAGAQPGAGRHPGA
jgi:hypothetical protein